MTRGRKKKGLPIRVKIFAASITFLLGSLAVFAFAEKLTPEEGLRKIVEIKTVGSDYSSVLYAPLAAIRKNELTKLWGQVVLARKLDLSGEKQLAIDLLQTMSAKIDSEDTGASFEATVLLSRLRLESGKKANLDNIDKKLELYRRKDLEAEYLYSLGLLYLQQKEDILSRSTFTSLREKYPASPFAKLARSLKGLSTPKPELKSIELLIKEGDIDSAAQELSSYQKLYPANSPEYYESLLVKESLFRKQKKPQEADELLLSIAADAPEASASTALYRSAKNAWNENNTLRALELLDQLFIRFPNYELRKEAQYTEARILEELGKLREAEKKYEAPILLLEKVGGDSKEILRLTRSIKRAVWLKFIRGDYSGSIKLSEQALKTLDQFPNDRELRIENNGLSYWIARSTLASHSDVAKEKALVIFRKIFQSDPRTFYGALSKEYIERETGEHLRFIQSPIPGCTLLDTADLGAKLGVFKDLQLRPYAQAEIDFTFGRLRSDSDTVDYSSLLKSQSQLSQTYGRASSGIELAEEGLRVGRKVSARFPCDSELAMLSYPKPYLDLYTKAGKLNSVSIPLALAISRSESYFSPEARSSVGALGLMQLMPDTARMEGWDGKIELTEPEINISLGVKHLKRLLNNFDGDIYKVSASYNAGAGAVNRWVDRYGILPSDLFVEFIGYLETNKYVRQVFSSKKVYEELTTVGDK